MPEVFSIGLGGGTKVEEVEGEVKVGPESVGHRLHTEGLIFGGNTLTTTGKIKKQTIRFRSLNIQ